MLGWQAVEEQIDKDAWVSGKLGGSEFIARYPGPFLSPFLPAPASLPLQLDPSLPSSAKW